MFKLHVNFQSMSWLVILCIISTVERCAETVIIVIAVCAVVIIVIIVIGAIIVAWLCVR